MNFNFGILAVILIFLGPSSRPIWASEHSSPAAHADGKDSGNEKSEGHGKGGTHAAPAHSTPANVVVIRDVPNDFLLPPKLWDQLLGHSVLKEVKASVEGQEDEVQGSSVLFASVTVRFEEKNPGVLKQPVIEYQFPKGGGQIDLSQITTGEPGTFYVRFDLGDRVHDPSFEAFHLSKARKRRYDDRIYGGGCKSFTKMTRVLRSGQDGKGMPFNTTRDLHVSSLGGHFLFSWSDGDSTTVTQVRFFDSAKPQYACQTQTQSEAQPGTPSDTEAE